MISSVGQIVKKWAEQSNLNVQYFESIHSTNDVAKDFSYADVSPWVFVTDAQTQGRGRGENIWSSGSHGTNLLMTWSFAVDVPPQPITSPLVGLGLYRAAVACWPDFGWGLKAPNDLLLKSGKVAGLLTESISCGEQHRLLVGIGMNLHSNPQVENSQALKDHTTRNLNEDLLQFLNLLLVELMEAVAAGQSAEINPAQRDELLKALSKGPLGSTILSVLPDGSLRTSTRTIHWYDL
jgi:BirA family biotin operon repressor/biotin-[acetyl-CoA-carboxylase] ligase